MRSLMFYTAPPRIIGVTKSRRIRWAGHVARMGERRGVYRVLVGKTRVKEATRENQA